MFEEHIENKSTKDAAPNPQNGPSGQLIAKFFRGRSQSECPRASAVEKEALLLKQTYERRATMWGARNYFR